MAGKQGKSSKRPATPAKKAIRARNLAKNEKLRAEGKHPKQLRVDDQKLNTINNQLHRDGKSVREWKRDIAREEGRLPQKQPKVEAPWAGRATYFCTRETGFKVVKYDGFDLSKR